MQAPPRRVGRLLLIVVAPAILACSDGTSPNPDPGTGGGDPPPAEAPALANVLTVTVTDSLGVPLGGVATVAKVWQGATLANWTAGGSSDEQGFMEYEWFPGPIPAEYDSLTIEVDELDLHCRPYAPVAATLAREDVLGLPGDSAHVVLALGLRHAPPPLAAGVSACAGGTRTSGQHHLYLQLNSVFATPVGDSVLGRWEIGFRETSVLLVTPEFGAVVRNDSLIAELFLDGDAYEPGDPCYPGLLLRASLDDGHLAGAALESLGEACSHIEGVLHPMVFVPWIPGGSGL